MLSLLILPLRRGEVNLPSQCYNSRSWQHWKTPVFWRWQLFGALLGAGRAQTLPVPSRDLSLCHPLGRRGAGDGHGRVVPEREARRGARLHRRRRAGISWRRRPGRGCGSSASTSPPAPPSPATPTRRKSPRASPSTASTSSACTTWTTTTGGRTRTSGTTRYRDRRHISPAQLDKLDYLIAQLKKNGIYADINLHVSRQFTECRRLPGERFKNPLQLR